MLTCTALVCIPQTMALVCLVNMTFLPSVTSLVVTALALAAAAAATALAAAAAPPGPAMTDPLRDCPGVYW